MKPIMSALGLAVALAVGWSAAEAQTTSPSTPEAQTTSPTTPGAEGLSAEQLDPARHLEQLRELEQVESVMVIDVEQAMAGARADVARQLIEASDPAAVREFLDEDTAAANEVKKALEQANVSEDQVRALAVRQPGVVVVFVGESS